MHSTSEDSHLTWIALLGAGESEISILAELHRNRNVHIIGVYDPDANAVGHELAEILGIPHGEGEEFFQQLYSAQQIVLPRERHRFEKEIQRLKQQGMSFLNHQDALSRYSVDRLVEKPAISPLSPDTERPLHHLEQTVNWLTRALDREELLRALLSIAIQAADAERGSIQLLDPMTQELYIAYAEGLSDHTIRCSRQKIGEGIAGIVAENRRSRLMHGSQPTASHDRSDILSSICVPLISNDLVLGVLNVSNSPASEKLKNSDLDCVNQVAFRISPVLQRLMEIQEMHERTLVEELEEELDRLMQMRLDILPALDLIQKLLRDLSGSDSSYLLILPPDGPAFRLEEEAGEDGMYLVPRKVDPTKGILSQILLVGSPVVLEEKFRKAGKRQIERSLTLYLPIGEPQIFALYRAHFSSLSTLSHFQRNMERIVKVLTPRLGNLLARHESQGRMERIHLLARGLSRLSTLDLKNRIDLSASLFLEQTSARAVAVWLGEEADPAASIQKGSLQGRDLQEVWPRLRDRLERSPEGRCREVDPKGSGLRSYMILGSPGGPTIAALNRAQESPLEESGFRDEDMEAAAFLMATLQNAPDMPESGPPPPQAEQRQEEILDDFQRNQKLLMDAMNRELARAQRYHFSFSLSCFRIDFSPSEKASGEPFEAFRMRVEQSCRATDCVLWIAEDSFCVLAPEESRGQKRLVKRLLEMMKQNLDDLGVESRERIAHSSVSYPRDAGSAEKLYERALKDLTS